MCEVWKDVVGYEGLYRVSNNGKIKSLAKWCGTHMKEECIKTPSKNAFGHLLINLWKNNKPKSFLVHRLVLEAFIGPCPAGMECRHFPDRNPENNNLENLSWGTREQNQADRVFHNTSNLGRKRPDISLKLRGKPSPLKGRKGKPSPFKGMKLPEQSERMKKWWQDRKSKEEEFGGAQSRETTT